jgi:glutamyl-tRNA synthetase
MQNSGNEKIRVRIAPSPTGLFHIGTARTALFNFLFAKKNGGVFIVRIEDTDKERSKGEYEKNILEGLAWLDIKYDEFYRQSERTEIYRQYLEKLIKDGNAYVSKEAAGEGKRAEVIRFKNPNTSIAFDDVIRGRITFHTEELGDFVIAKDMDTPLYHLAVTVDDHEMGITHVIRGEDHISNTPRQILLLSALGAKIPKYAHLPLILAPDKSKLSKRHGSVSITEYKEAGFLPESLINFLAILGWSPQSRGEDTEIMELSELIEKFELEKVGKSGAIFDIKKLEWINRQYLKKIPQEKLSEIIKKELARTNATQIEDAVLLRATPFIMEKINVISDISPLTEGEFSFLVSQPVYGKEKLIWKGESEIKTKDNLTAVLKLLEGVNPNDFSAESIKEMIFPFADKEGRGGVLWPMRFSLTGKEKSPDPFTSAYLLGKDESVSRILSAIKLFE